MRSSWLLLSSLMLTTFIAASLLAGLATFDAQALPQAIRSQLVRSPGMSVVVIGLVDARLAAADTAAVAASVRTAFRGVPYRLDGAVWSGPLALTAPGGTARAGAEVAAPARLRANARLTAGTWPGAPRAGGPIPAALPAAVAAQLDAAPGAVLALRDPSTGARLRLRVTGLYRQRDPAARYWGIDQIWTCDGDFQRCFTSHGPIVVSPAAFGRGGLVVDQASWVALPDASRIGTGQLAGLAARTQRAEAHLQKSAALGGLVADSGMPAALAGARTDLAVARSLLVIGGLQLLLPAAGALLLIAGLLASHRDEEHALLSARGAARWQLARPALAEAIAAGAAAAAAGAVAGPQLAALLANRGLLRSAGLRLSGVPAQAWWSALAVLILGVVIMVGPALRPAAPGAARTRRGRPPARAAAVRAGGDLALVALGAAAVWQLHSYAAGARPAPGGLILVLAPALALAGMAVIPLRVLPLAARLLDRVASAGRHLSAALASWEISRRPIRQAVPALLAILAVATGTLALAQYQSWRQSALDQAAFSAGADVRVDTAVPVPLGTAATITRARGVTAAAPLAAAATGLGGDVLALDAQTAGATVLLRRDLSPLPAAALFRRITPRGPAAGLAVPGRPARLEITAALAPGAGAGSGAAGGAGGAPGGAGRAAGGAGGAGDAGGAGGAPGPAGGGPAGLGSASVTASVQDAYGAVYAVPAGVLPADGRSHALTVVLSPARQASYPLRLLGLSLSYLMPPATPGGAVPPPAGLAVSSIAAAATRAGPLAAPFADGRVLAAWRPAAAAPDLSNLAAPATAAAPTPSGAEPSVTSWQAAPGGARRLTFRPGSGPAAARGSGATATVTLTAPLRGGPVAGIATRAFLRNSSVGVGATLPVTVGAATVPVHIVAAVAAFPTATGGGGAVIVDLAAVQQALVGRLAEPLPVTSWFLHTAAPGGPSGLPSGAVVTSRARRAAGLLSDPVSAAPEQAALAVAGAGALLAAIGFSVSIAAGLRSRRPQNAMLAALGVSRSGQARQLCLEELMLCLPAAAAGLLAGAWLAHLLIPAVTITPAATTPVPPVLVEVPLGWAIGLAVAVAVIPVLVAALTVARRPDPAAQLRATEAA
jgi:hypothetical protein